MRLTARVRCTVRPLSIQGSRSGLLLVWPHVAALVALAAACFAVAYFGFIRDEVRA